VCWGLHFYFSERMNQIKNDQSEISYLDLELRNHLKIANKLIQIFKFTLHILLFFYINFHQSEYPQVIFTLQRYLQYSHLKNLQNFKHINYLLAIQISREILIQNCLTFLYHVLIKDIQELNLLLIYYYFLKCCQNIFSQSILMLVSFQKNFIVNWSFSDFIFIIVYYCYSFNFCIPFHHLKIHSNKTSYALLIYNWYLIRNKFIIYYRFYLNIRVLYLLSNFYLVKILCIKIYFLYISLLLINYQ
jgi:hypothetical protein